MLEWLSGVAKRAGLSLGVKFSNTLVVQNTRGRLAGEHVYLSGAPLRVIATTLADQFVQATQARFPVSFSAGIDADNFADAVANGFTPVTTCTDLLQPTGYRRLPRYLKALEADMERVGATNIAEYVRARAGVMPTVPVPSAAAMNLHTYAESIAAEPRYHARGRPSRKPARAPLPLFDCDSVQQLPARLPQRLLPLARDAADRAGERRLFARAAVGRGRRHVQRVRQLRHALPAGGRPVPREAALDPPSGSRSRRRARHRRSWPR